jgi:hypothetical protein
MGIQSCSAHQAVEITAAAILLFFYLPSFFIFQWFLSFTKLATLETLT